MESWITPYVVWCMSRSSGKALDLNTRIPTPSGDKTMGDIHVGDYVFDDAGKPTKVIYESPVYFNHDCYKVTFDDGEEIIADADHNWYMHYKCRTVDENGCKVFTTKDMYKNFIHVHKGDAKNGCIEYRYRVDRCKPLQYEKKELPIHPYILGLWLGDGKTDDGYINVHNSDCEEMCRNIQAVGYKIYSINKDCETQKRIRIHLPNDEPLKVALRNLDVLCNKHIPDDYLYSDVQDRLYLLQGLMDTDGSVFADGRCEFSQAEKHVEIIDGISKLLTSLGIKNNVKKCFKKCNGVDFPTYRISFTTDKEVPCFMMMRKYERMIDNPDGRKYAKKSVVNIEKVDTRPVKCI